MKRKLALIALLGAVLGCLCFSSKSVVALDMRAFYCAGFAWDHGGNPYHAEPLYYCEAHRTDNAYSRLMPGVALPAPVPAYDIAAFGLLARLPFPVAKLLWGSILGFCISVAVLALARLTKISATVIFAILATGLVGPSLALGQIVPLYLAASCIAMMFVSEGKYRCAAVAAACSLVEPHLGLPLCIGLALWVAQSRAVLALSVSTLCIVALAALGLVQNIEYVTVVLPLHALSELASDNQLSSSVVMHALGFSDEAALRGGSIAYAIATIAGAYFGGLAAKQFRNAAFVIAVPAAFSLLGGTFLHGTDIVAAIPLVLLLFVYAPAHRTWHVAALVLLSIPFSSIQGEPAVGASWFAFTGFAIFCIIRQLGNGSRWMASVCAAVVFVGLMWSTTAYRAQRNAFLNKPHPVSVAIDRKYPEFGWAIANREAFSVESSAVWFSRIPTWLGLGLAAAGAFGATSLRPRLKVVS